MNNKVVHEAGDRAVVLAAIVCDDARPQGHAQSLGSAPDTVNRTAGEIVLKSHKRHAEKAEAHSNRALDAARKQQAKSWELRAAMSMARLWRDQGQAKEVRELLAPVYGWSTEGFDTLDLKSREAEPTINFPVIISLAM